MSNTPNMTVEEAEAACKLCNFNYGKSKEHLAQCRRVLYALCKRNGWSALGYKTQEEFAQDRLGICRNYLGKLLKATKVEIDLHLSDKAVINENVLRVLGSIQDSDETKEVAKRKAVYEAAVLKYGDKATAAQIEDMAFSMNALKPKVEPTPIVHAVEFDAVQGLCIRTGRGHTSKESWICPSKLAALGLSTGTQEGQFEAGSILNTTSTQNTTHSQTQVGTIVPIADPNAQPDSILTTAYNPNTQAVTFGFVRDDQETLHTVARRDLEAMYNICKTLLTGQMGIDYPAPNLPEPKPTLDDTSHSARIGAKRDHAEGVTPALPSTTAAREEPTPPVPTEAPPEPDACPSDADLSAARPFPSLEDTPLKVGAQFQYRGPQWHFARDYVVTSVLGDSVKAKRPCDGYVQTFSRQEIKAMEAARV